MGKTVKVTIIINSQKVRCEGQCAPDWSAAEIFDVAEQRIKERFGDTVTLELSDLSGTGELNNYWLNRVKKENLNLPLLVVNDEVRIPGEFDIRQMLDAIEAEQEIYGTGI